LTCTLQDYDIANPATSKMSRNNEMNFSLVN
jgi:hypothetical protein